MSVVVPPKIYGLLKNIVNGNIDRYSIIQQGSNKKGEGYLSDMYYVALKDKVSGTVLYFIIKQSLSGEVTRKEFPIRRCFLNEIYFYEKIWPAFQKFQIRIPPQKRFDKIPKCFATLSEDPNEKLVFENLRYQDFATFNKKSTLDREHTEYIFKEYGKFHAVSFAYKTLSPREYLELTKGVKQLWSNLYEVNSFKSMIKSLHEMGLNSLDTEEHADVIEKYKHYVEDGGKMFHDSTIYKGNYSVVLHGDCWSNNMMFKYDESKRLTDMRLLDFQYLNMGTPVSDLCYCLYSGAPKEILDELDYYLKIYHDILLENVEEFGCNSENIYSFEELKKDWKQYCNFGFTLGLMLWRNKLTDDDDIKDLTDLKDGDDTDAFLATKYDEETFRKRARDLVLHMYENDFL